MCPVLCYIPFYSTVDFDQAEFVIVLLSTMNKLSKQDVMLASRVFDSLDISKNGIFDLHHDPLIRLELIAKIFFRYHIVGCIR